MERSSARKYTAKFKLQVVAEAEESNIVQAAKQFDIGENSVRNWRKWKENLKAAPPYKCVNRGSKCKWPHFIMYKNKNNSCSNNPFLLATKKMFSSVVGLNQLIWKA